ncbi:MAG: hypothetical protein P4L69_11905 [Desulfosporosinus sp.]|nr:hypothetical protein [Desulfosporosinus sp.]
MPQFICVCLNLYIISVYLTNQLHPMAQPPQQSGAAALETFQGKMMLNMPGTIMFCGHRKTGLKQLMRLLVEYVLDRPQAAEEAEDLYVEIYLSSPDPLWTSIKDGRKDSRINIFTPSYGSEVSMSSTTIKRLADGQKPKSHLIVVIDDSVNIWNREIWHLLASRAADYNITCLLYCSQALPEKMKFIEDTVNAVAIPWFISPESRTAVYKVFATCFGKEEEWEEHYKRITAAGSAVVIEYKGSVVTAYGVKLPLAEKS